MILSQREKSTCFRLKAISCGKYFKHKLDPDTSVNGWGENDRGVSFVFGMDHVCEFLEKHDLGLLVRRIRWWRMGMGSLLGGGW